VPWNTSINGFTVPFLPFNCLVILEKIKNTNTPFYRPPLPQQESEGVHPGILTLMKECWTEEPSKRPPFTEIAKAIRTVNKGRSVFLRSQHFRYVVVWTKCKTVV